MKAYYIYPDTIGCGTEWSERWVDFCRQLGYGDSTPSFVLVSIINIQN